MDGFWVRSVRAGCVVGAVTVLLAGCSSTVGSAPSEPATTPTVGDTTSGYPVVDTGQSATYDATAEIDPPPVGEAFAGQDAQVQGNQPDYTDNGDGTVTDEVTGLMWSQSPDLDGDGDIDADDKLTYDQAMASASEVSVGGYDDWRVPSIKELYSLIQFTGIDPSGYTGTETEGLVPFIDTDYFDFGYGDTDAGERIIDAQMATSTLYLDTTMNGQQTMFGVNFADGRIKGYGLQGGPDSPGGKQFYVYYVRGASDYGVNDFTDNGDGTVTDEATGLMWSQSDSGSGMTWQEALAWAEQANTEQYLGHSDWRLPNVKELQSIVDYTRSPGTTDSAALDPVLEATAITNEAGQADYAAYWSSTTHVNTRPDAPGAAAAYVAFGRSLGNMGGQWIDVHGAGSQRSDPKQGDAADYPQGFGPQGDAIRIDNLVRLVRDSD